MRYYTKKELIDKLEDVKLLCLDVDGTLTDGGMYLDENNNGMKRFFAHDGTGIAMIRQIGVEVALVSTSLSSTLKERARALKLDHCILGSYDKGASITELCNKLDIKLSNTIHMGDDVNDILGFKAVGLPIGVNNCVDAVNDFICYKTEKEGGSGAVREICDLILLAKTGSIYGLPYLDAKTFAQ